LYVLVVKVLINSRIILLQFLKQSKILVRLVKKIRNNRLHISKYFLMINKQLEETGKSDLAEIHPANLAHHSEKSSSCTSIVRWWNAVTVNPRSLQELGVDSCYLSCPLLIYYPILADTVTAIFSCNAYGHTSFSTPAFKLL